MNTEKLSSPRSEFRVSEVNLYLPANAMNYVSVKLNQTSRQVFHQHTPLWEENCWLKLVLAGVIDIYHVSLVRN